jgi:hypothetical protein
MNIPSRIEDNWGWRFHPGTLTREMAEALAVLVEVTDRDPRNSSDRQQGYREVCEDFSA